MYIHHAREPKVVPRDWKMQAKQVTWEHLISSQIPEPSIYMYITCIMDKDERAQGHLWPFPKGSREEA